MTGLRCQASEHRKKKVVHSPKNLETESTVPLTVSSKAWVAHPLPILSHTETPDLLATKSTSESNQVKWLETGKEKSDSCQEQLSAYHEQGAGPLDTA